MDDFFASIQEAPVFLLNQLKGRGFQMLTFFHVAAGMLIIPCIITQKNNIRVLIIEIV